MKNEAPDALALLQAIYNNEDLPIWTRMDAAKAAVKFERPTLSAVALHETSAVGMAERMERARQRLAESRSPAAKLLLTYANGQGDG